MYVDETHLILITTIVQNRKQTRQVLTVCKYQAVPLTQKKNLNTTGNYANISAYSSVRYGGAAVDPSTNLLRT